MKLIVSGVSGLLLFIVVMIVRMKRKVVIVFVSVVCIVLVMRMFFFVGIEKGSVVCFICDFWVDVFVLWY